MDNLELMKQEILEVIKKYIDIDEEAMDVRLATETNEDGTQGAPALYANIPIINIKDETRKMSKTNQENHLEPNGIKIESKKTVNEEKMPETENRKNDENNEAYAEEKTEEDAEADPEAKEELPEYPAFDMSATAGNVTVHVTAAEGVLPSGAQLIVKRVTRKAILNAVEETVTEKDKEVDSAIALDITIVNADGIEIQPNGIVNVSFENVAVGGEEVNVYHVTDDASTVTEVATNTQSFDANHFSIYVITGEKKVELTTFNFVAEGNTVSTQIVKQGIH